MDGPGHRAGRRPEDREVSPGHLSPRTLDTQVFHAERVEQDEAGRIETDGDHGTGRRGKRQLGLSPTGRLPSSLPYRRAP